MKFVKFVKGIDIFLVSFKVLVSLRFMKRKIVSFVETTVSFHKTDETKVSFNETMVSFNKITVSLVYGFLTLSDYSKGIVKFMV